MIVRTFLQSSYTLWLLNNCPDMNPDFLWRAAMCSQPNSLLKSKAWAKHRHPPQYFSLPGLQKPFPLQGWGDRRSHSVNLSQGGCGLIIHSLLSDPMETWLSLLHPHWFLFWFLSRVSFLHWVLVGARKCQSWKQKQQEKFMVRDRENRALLGLA